MDGDANSVNDGSDDLPALIERLGQALARPPADNEDRLGRAIEINLLMAGIDEHGVDATALIRFGMKTIAWLPVMILLIVTPENQRAEVNRAIDFDGWLEVLGLTELPIASTEEGVTEETAASAVQLVVDRAARRLPHWVELAPIAEIIDLKPPAPALLETIPTAVPSEDVTDAYQWLWERYGRPGFDKWTASSLRLEFLWREGDWTPPFPARALVVDRSRDGELHRELASRFVSSPLDSGEPDLLNQLQDQAIQYLVHGRFAEAAALFEFYLQREPDHHTARNNLGFCLLPLDPALALTHLERVGRSAEINRTMHTHNICTALAALGRQPEGLDRAEYHWQRQAADDRGGAFLWRTTGQGLQIYHAPDLQLALAELGLELARAAGAQSRETRWSERVRALRASSTAEQTA